MVDGYDTAHQQGQPAATSENSLVFPVTVTGTDGGSPARASRLMTFTCRLTAEAGSLAKRHRSGDLPVEYTGQSNTSYAFYSIAHDAAGNVESKKPLIEASTYVPNLTPPVTTVDATTGTNPSTLNTTTGTFTLNMTGNDPGGGQLTYFDVFASVDSGPYTLVNGAAVPAAPPDSSGNYPHDYYLPGPRRRQGAYLFLLQRRHRRQGKRPIDAYYAEPDADRDLRCRLFAAGDRPDRGGRAVERSYIRYLNVTFNESDAQSDGALTQIINSLGTSSPDLLIYKYDLNGDGSSTAQSGVPVSLAGVTATVIDHAIELDSAPRASGGARRRQRRMATTSWT